MLIINSVDWQIKYEIRHQTEKEIIFVHFAPRDHHIRETWNNKNCRIWTPFSSELLSVVPKFSIKKKDQNNFFLHPHESLWSIEYDSKTDYECKVNLGMGNHIINKLLTPD